MRQVIAFIGPRGCGKSTAAKHLTNNYGYTRHFFAKPIKEMVKCLGLTEEHVNGKLKEMPTDLLLGKSPRWAQQSIGTEWGRELIGENIWVQAWHNTMPEGNIVCDDLRFPNELEMVRSMNAIVIRVDRPGVKLTLEHESEAHDLPFDFGLRNDGTIDQLNDKIDVFMKKLANGEVRSW